MEQTWSERVFRRRPHPVLRALGNLATCAAEVVFAVVVITQLHSAWRWLAVPVGFLGLVSAGRGVAVAVRDLRRRGAASMTE